VVATLNNVAVHRNIGHQFYTDLSLNQRQSIKMGSWLAGQIVGWFFAGINIIGTVYWLIRLGIHIARHPAYGAGHYTPNQLPVPCWLCKMLDFESKALLGMGQTIGKIRAAVVRFGRPGGWDLSLPMYEQTGTQTPHDLRNGQNPALQLLAIPYDIRHAIYHSLIETVIALDCPPAWTSRPNNGFLSITALLRVCHQTRQEFLPIFYNNILFSIYPRSPFYRFYRHPQPSPIHQLREIHLDFDTAPTMIERCWRDLREARAAREIYFTFKRIELYLACAPYLDLLLLEARCQDVLPDLRLFQVVVAWPPLLSLNSSTVGAVLETAARSHLRSARFWPRGKLGTFWLKSHQFCTRVYAAGYESSLERRCKAVGVENPIIECP